MTPTIQRMAVLEFLERTHAHPTAEEVYAGVREGYPTIARATVYNTLDALTKVGAILRLTIDPAAARYDADLGPHVHFRCRICDAVYDIAVEKVNTLGATVLGHRVESVRTYAYGVCATCGANASLDESLVAATPAEETGHAGPPIAEEASIRGAPETSPPASSTTASAQKASSDEQKTRNVSSPLHRSSVEGFRAKKPSASSTYSSDNEKKE